MSKRTRYSQEVRERAVRMVFEHGAEHTSEWAAIQSIATKIGCSAETLRNWVRRTQVDTGSRAGVTSEERARFKELERENPNSGGPTRSSARHRRILPRRSSTADRRDGDLHRRSS